MPAANQKIDVTAEYLQEMLEARSNTAPVPTLTHRAENRIIRELRDLAMRGCEYHLHALAECAKGRTVSAVWHCRKFSKAIDSCMKEFAKDEALINEMRRRHAAKFPQAVKGYRGPSTLSGQNEPGDADT